MTGLLDFYVMHLVAGTATAAAAAAAADAFRQTPFPGVAAAAISDLPYGSANSLFLR